MSSPHEWEVEFPDGGSTLPASTSFQHMRDCVSSDAKDAISYALSFPHAWGTKSESCFLPGLLTKCASSGLPANSQRYSEAILP